MRQMLILAVWVLPLVILGLLFGVIMVGHGGHGWQAIPVAGALYGLVSGVAFIIVVQFGSGFTKLHDVTFCIGTAAISSSVSAITLYVLADLDLFAAALLVVLSSVLIGWLISYVYNSVYKPNSGT